MASKTKKFPSELRYDPVSQDWVVIATGRARRPESFKTEKRVGWKDSEKNCPFERMEAEEQPTLAFFQGKKMALREGRYVPKKWTTLALHNKFPAFMPYDSLEERVLGPYKTMNGVGYHEVILTKDHTKDIPEFSVGEVKETIDVYQERYLDLMNEQFINYIAIFRNKGPGAGASIAHPHSQIVAIPTTDTDIQRSIRGSLHFWEVHKSCVHCAMLKWDIKDKQRIVFENDCFVVVCSFAARVAFETRIFPKKHSAYFERVEDHEKECLAEAFLVALKKLKGALHDPDYNYFLHTAPADGKNYDHYHWHWEILPKTSTWAGFELGTGIQISTIEPEKAAAFLRKH